MKGHLMQVNVSVKNNGTAASSVCNTSFWLSTTTGTTSSSVYLTTVSLPTIAANSTYSFQLIYPVPYSVNLGGNYLVISIDDKNNVTESNETNNYFYYPTLIQIFNDTSAVMHIPYPVLLVHGLSSSDQTWTDFIDDVKNILGWSFGGVLDFCLNQDGNTSLSLFVNDFSDYTNTFNLTSGDFYAINFDVDNMGIPHGNDVQSNQSAIYKQGYAVRNAVHHIMQETGKNKVILLGHSMGGLASREYVQNPSKYQSDNQHHVAKIITLGTPHGGSNAGPTFSPLTPDGQSEAVRDLRTTYYYSNNPGVFLFGGLESLSYMDDQLCCYFYNADVNCNGVTGEWITGLNQKSFPNNIEIVCNIGDGDILGGDGVVSTTSADINNFINLNADTFIMMKTGFNNWHLQLTQQTSSIMRSLDEPRDKNYAFEINDSTHYFALLNVPSRKYTGSYIDEDVFSMNLQQGVLHLSVFNIPTNQFTVSILNAGGSVLYNSYPNGKTQIVQNFNIPSSGTYYLKIKGLANPNCQYCQYSVYYTNTPIVTDIPFVEYEEINLSVFPNPVIDRLNVEYDSEFFDTPEYQIYSIDGKMIAFGVLDNSYIDVSGLNEGMYLIMFKDKIGNYHYKKFVKGM